jgi:hypothetical protein
MKPISTTALHALFFMALTIPSKNRPFPHELIVLRLGAALARCQQLTIALKKNLSDVYLAVPERGYNDTVTIKDGHCLLANNSRNGAHKSLVMSAIVFCGSRFRFRT